MMVSLVSSDFSVSFSFRGLGHRFQLQSMLLTLSGLCTPLLQGEHFSKQNSLVARTAPVVPTRSDYRGSAISFQAD